MFVQENHFELFEKVKKELEKIKCKHSDNDIKKISKDVDGKLERMENRIETQRKQLEENNAKIASLELRVEELEKKFLNEKKYKDRKIKDLENLLKNKRKKQ